MRSMISDRKNVPNQKATKEKARANALAHVEWALAATGLKQSSLAKEAGLPPSTINKFMSGQVESVLSTSTLEKIDSAVLRLTGRVYSKETVSDRHLSGEEFLRNSPKFNQSLDPDENQRRFNSLIKSSVVFVVNTIRDAREDLPAEFIGSMVVTVINRLRENPASTPSDLTKEVEAMVAVYSEYMARPSNELKQMLMEDPEWRSAGTFSDDQAASTPKKPIHS